MSTGDRPNQAGGRKTNRNISIDKARREVLSETIRNRDTKKLNQFQVERFYLIKMIRDDSDSDVVHCWWILLIC